MIKAISLVQSFRSKHLWFLLLIETFILLLLLKISPDPFQSQWNRLKYQQFFADEPSYLMFSFTSLRSILDNYRSAGLPLFLRLYKLVFNEYQFWPHFQFAIYLISIYFLFWAFLKFGFDKILSFIVVSLLLWNIDSRIIFPAFHFYTGLPLIITEILCVSLLHITIGFMLLAIKYNKWFIYLAYAISLFLVYQIRSNVSYIPILAPVWAVVFSKIFNGVRFSPNSHPGQSRRHVGRVEGSLQLRVGLKRFLHSLRSHGMTRSIFLRFVLLSWIPLFLFGFLRFLVLGQFGFSTMTGGTLAGHAVRYLDENNAVKLEGVSKIIGEEILRRKRKITYPCNLSPFSQDVINNLPKIKQEAKCFGFNLMTAWQVAIKYETGKEPFEDPERNIEAWNYVQTLAPFHMMYYRVTTDKILMKFSLDVFKLEWKQYFSWILQGGLYSVKHLFSKKLISLSFILYLLIFAFVRRKLKKWSRSNLQLKFWKQQLVSISILAFSNFIIGYLLLLIFNYPFDRMFLTIIPYIFPALVLWAIPPFWLEKTE